MEKTPNVVEATNKPRLYDRLEAIQNSLTVCEKALAEYLETKRLAFPRFYFVSSADLLDILSQGNNPSLVGFVGLYEQSFKLVKFEHFLYTYTYQYVHWHWFNTLMQYMVKF